MFSVIIPVFNAEKTLSRCLDSLLAQAGNIAELIIVNDGSTDGSSQICESYYKQYPQVVYIDKSNGGVSSARNAGLEKARGDFITFVDSDDYVSPDYFSALSHFQNVDFLFFSLETERESISSGVITGSFLSGTTDYTSFLQKFVILRNGSPCNKRFRRSIIQQYDIRFPEELFIGEDFIFCLRYLFKAQSGFVLDRILYHQDETSGSSLTRKYNHRFTEQALQIYTLSYQAVTEASISLKQANALLKYLDYNRCRTAFACIMEHFKLSEKSYSSLKPEIKIILSSFKREMWQTRLIGLSHLGMRLCISNGWSFLAYLIAKGKFLTKTVFR